MHIFIFNRALRLHDNTTLIHMAKLNLPIVPIFIFTEQVNKRKNAYFSNNAVEFMIESLQELADDIHKLKGKLYFFHCDDIIKALAAIHKQSAILSIGTNYDYTPYARDRQAKFAEFCTKHNITFYMQEDHCLYNILDGQTLKADHSPYTVFTPFKNNALKLPIRAVDPYKGFTFKTVACLEANKYYLAAAKINQFYEPNNKSETPGGRAAGLKILQNIEQFADYGTQRDYFLYSTTRLAAHNHFGTVSIREVYHKIHDVLKKRSAALINELIWRDFYYQLYYYFPHMLAGQIGGKNQAFRPKFNHIKWCGTPAIFKAWCEGRTGIPLCDAAMRQLNQTGFMPNRLRMICAGVLTKIFLITWKQGEQYFAQKLKDYDAVQNSAGWAWTITGIDPQQVFRIFSPKIQSKKFDSECKYILKYVPELADVPHNDIHNWDEKHAKHTAVKYPAPVVNYHSSYKRALAELARVHKLKK